MVDDQFQTKADERSSETAEDEISWLSCFLDVLGRYDMDFPFRSIIFSLDLWDKISSKTDVGLRTAVGDAEGEKGRGNGLLDPCPGLVI